MNQIHRWEPARRLALDAALKMTGKQSKTFISDLPCKHHGELPDRYIKTGACTQCVERYNQRSRPHGQPDTVYYGARRERHERQVAFDAALQDAYAMPKPRRAAADLFERVGRNRAYRIHPLYVSLFETARRAINLGLEDLI